MAGCGVVTGVANTGDSLWGEIGAERTCHTDTQLGLSGGPKPVLHEYKDHKECFGDDDEMNAWGAQWVTDCIKDVGERNYDGGGGGGCWWQCDAANSLCSLN